MRNESFSCEQCGKFVFPHPNGSARNHCPFCLYSKHLDKAFPGDRESGCLALMKPVKKEHKKKGWMIIHQCQQCGKEIPNILAPDDDIVLFSRLGNNILI